MSEFLVKVCGLATPETIRDIEALNPDFSGFIFYPGSPRFIPPDTVRAIPRSGTTRRIGVVVNMAIPALLETLESSQVDGIQLHGDEDIDFCRILREEFSKRWPHQRKILLKAIRVASPDEVEQAAARFPDDTIDYLLFDTATSDGTFGGTGRQFNWEYLSCYRGKTPVILSGGIDPTHIATLAQLRSTLAVVGTDINSRFEVSPGVKDVSKVRSFIAAIRGA